MRKSAKETPDTRVTVQVAVLPQANQIVSEWCDDTGMTKAKFLQRLVEWFAIMPLEFRQMIVGVVPPEQRQVFAEKAVKKVAEWVEVGDWKDGRKPDRLRGIIPDESRPPAAVPKDHRR